MFGFKLGLQLEIEEDHEAFWSWRDDSDVVHQLRPIWGMSLSDGTPHIIEWRPRCDPAMVKCRKHNTTPITCVACLGWRGTTEAP